MRFHLREWCCRLLGLVRSRESETDKELRFHLEMAEQDALRRGGSVREARIRAGGMTQAAAAVRDQGATGWISDVLRDSRPGVRLLRKSPQFTIVAILCLALGIGGVAAIFSVFDAVLIRPLPYTDAGRLVMIWDLMAKTDAMSRHNPTPVEWIEWRRLNTRIYRPRVHSARCRDTVRRG